MIVDAHHHFWDPADGDVFAATRTVFAELSPDKRAAVFGGTAIEAYRLAIDDR